MKSLTKEGDLPLPMKLGTTIQLNGQNWLVCAVLYIGERYYMLQRKGNPRKKNVNQVALMPADIVEFKP